ncbi:hypothetical protein [Bacillus cereus]|uniref:Ig-like domain-containing protein n=1 Tax=Bacillus cereus TIAC219 TaxID=718222 RepID=A0ABC9SRG7_BACCE|nr:hypothetical protein [Bacillus cereus]EJP82290.1 hypothetical protein IC1_05938 [Bacillus cereus VD022]EOQ58411.1 hypothetical protein IAY_06167 [Bacillus cereus TIAC219]
MKKGFDIKGKRVRNIISKNEGVALCVKTINRGLDSERDVVIWIRDGKELETESPIKNMLLLETE